MALSKRIIGKSIERVDALEKISGKNKYIDDINFNDGLYGGIVRSNIAHGKYLGYILDSNWQWDDYVIVDSLDITGKNAMLSVISDHPFLVEEDKEINYIGEPCLLIAHKSKDMVLEGIRHIKLNIKPLDIFPDIKQITYMPEEKRPKPHDKTISIDKGNVDNIFNELPKDIKIIEGIYATGYHEQLYLETQGVDAWWKKGKLYILGSLQCPYYVHGAMKSLFNLDDDKVSVMQSDTGGAFGGKEEFPSLLAGHVALLSKKSGKRVRIVFSRKEDILYTTKRHPTITKIKSAVRKDGKIIAIKTETFMDTGAYITLSPVVLARAILHMTAPYEIENVNIKGYLYKTNTPSNGAFRGFGAPQAFFVMETHIERIASQLGLDSIKLRRINYHKKNSLTATCQNLRDDVWCKEVMDKAIKLSNYYKKQEAIKQYNKTHTRMKRGIGLSLVYHGSAFTGSGEKKMSPKLRIDINKKGYVYIRCASIEMGQGAKTVLRQVVADTLNIDMDKVIYENPNTDIVPNSGPTVASRTVIIVGGLIRKACKKAMKEKNYHGKSFEVEYEQPTWINWDEETYKGDAYPGYSYMCSVVELEINLSSLVPRILSITAVVEAGQIINPELARGQIAGGIAQSIGWALIENPIYHNGLMRNPSLSKYLIPSIEDIPELKIEFLDTAQDSKEYKPKGIGELPMNSPCVASTIALSNALNINIDEIPLNASKLYSLLEYGGK